MFVSLSRPPLLPGHRLWFSLGPLGPRPGTPGLAPSLGAQGLPAPRARSPPRGRCPPPLSAEPRLWVPNGLARARWAKVPRLVRGHPGRAFLDHPVGTLRCSSFSVLILRLKITPLVAITLRFCGCLYIQTFFPAPTPTSSCPVYIVNPLNKHRN